MSEVVRKLRQWSREQRAPIAAAVELLIRHGYWLNREAFIRSCVQQDDRQAWISWSSALRHLTDNLHANPSERAILAYAIALATDQYCFSRMDQANAHLFLWATTHALGNPRTRRSCRVRRQERKGA